MTAPPHPPPDAYPRHRDQCACDDPAVDRLRDLIAQGVDQVTASHLIWPAPSPTEVTEWSG